MIGNAGENIPEPVFGILILFAVPIAANYHTNLTGTINNVYCVVFQSKNPSGFSYGVCAYVMKFPVVSAQAAQRATYHQHVRSGRLR